MLIIGRDRMRNIAVNRVSKIIDSDFVICLHEKKLNKIMLRLIDISCNDVFIICMFHF